jgi:hypothetical protein
MFIHRPMRRLVFVIAFVGVLAACDPQKDAPASDPSASDPQQAMSADASATASPAAKEHASQENPSPSSAPSPAPAAPSAAALKYDNQIVHQPEAGRGKDDGWFLVKDGKRRWITDDQWPAANGYDPHSVIYITKDEFYSIPEDARPLPNPEETAGN